MWRICQKNRRRSVQLSFNRANEQFDESERESTLRAAPRKYQLDEEIVKKWPDLKL